jgi:hypothetical protein
MGWRVHKNPQIQISRVRPRHLRSFQNMHLAWFNYNNDHAGSINIIINKRRAQEYFSLNYIKSRFANGYIIVISPKGFIANYYPFERTLLSTYGRNN